MISSIWIAVQSHRLQLAGFGSAAYIWTWLLRHLNVRDYWTGKLAKPVRAIASKFISDFASYWHGYEIHGAEHVTASHCLLVGYHSRCTIDALYVWCRLHASFVISHIFFSIPVMSSFVRGLGAVPAKSSVTDTTDDGFARLLLESDRPVMLLPGGGHEAMKSWSQRYVVDWKKEPGFARVIANSDILSQSRESIGVVPFYTRNSESIWYTTPWWHDYSGQFLRNGMAAMAEGHYWSIPLTLSVALYAFGFTQYPRPVKLDTYFGEPLFIRPNETAESFARRVQGSLQLIIDEVNASPPRQFQKQSMWWIPYDMLFILHKSIILTTLNSLNLCVFLLGLPPILAAYDLTSMLTSLQKKK
jgi:1-acyl-sn-glycerol-3-phosphate acyltransferase